MPNSRSALDRLARLYNVLTSYQDMDGQPCVASDESLIAVLRELGAGLNGRGDIAQALLEKQLDDWTRVIDPVVAIWENEKPGFLLRLPESALGRRMEAHLASEDSHIATFSAELTPRQVVTSQEIQGTRFCASRCEIPIPLTPGYYTLTLFWNGRQWQSLVISAPLMAFGPVKPGEKRWGVFLPLYSLHSSGSWGAGDYTDLAKLSAWTASRGGSLVGTLPLLPSYAVDKFGQQPYLPISKQFWNEFYVDVNRAISLVQSPAALALVESDQFREQVASLKSSHQVDYAAAWKLKCQVLAILAEEFFAAGLDSRPDFRQFLQSKPAVDYARFRAAAELQGADWRLWPGGMRAGTLIEGDFSPQRQRLFLFAQWQAELQMRAQKGPSGADKPLLYLDVPLGVHPGGYDTWRERGSFVAGACAGAPPDPVFTSGQNWNFPPLHPQAIRNTHYRYTIASLRHQMRQAGMVRIDHMMGFHRLYWIPAGIPTSQGVYVGYPADEYYAILCLESQRNRCIVVGEDLGIVPPEVRPAMDKHGVFRLFVGEYELISQLKLGQIPRRAIASLNTHDMFPFAAFWEEKDIPERLRLNLVSPAGAQKELEQRREAKRAMLSVLEYKHLDNRFSQDTLATLKALLALLAESQAYALLINLEDLWLEIIPQNIPGLERRQNWSRPASYSFEEFTRLPQLVEILDFVARARREVSDRQ
jgi:4-alpha-glucanotransferase